jgi:hypothetical protein
MGIALKAVSLASWKYQSWKYPCASSVDRDVTNISLLTHLTLTYHFFVIFVNKIFK